MDLVSLEDPVFEKRFKTLGSDQVEARYILSTSLMERIAAFRHEDRDSVALSFVDNRVFIAISDTANRFEPPSIWSGSAEIGKEDLVTYLGDVSFAEDIVEALVLNRRIWSKRSTHEQGATAERGT